MSKKDSFLSKLGKENNIIKLSLIVNIIVAILAMGACIIMYTGFKFMQGYEPLVETKSFSMLRFFTVDSNIFVAIVSLIFAIQEFKLLKGKINEIPTKTYILKLMATTGVGLTFLVVFIYLGPISVGGLPSMLRNSNLFFHLVIPVLSMLNFTILERTDKIKFKYAFCGIIPTALYGVYYLTNIFIHMENGNVSPLYDWYWFVQNGVWTAIIVVPILFSISYIICLVLWRLNKRSDKK